MNQRRQWAKQLTEKEESVNKGILMWDYFKLPNQYLIDQEIEVADFVRKAELTEIEKDEISKFVLKITIKYDYRFFDEKELFFLDVELRYRKNKSTFKRIAHNVAHGIPHQCMIYVHDDAFGSVSCLKSRQNKQNVNRSIFIVQATISEFSIDSPEKEIVDCLLGITNALENYRQDSSKAINRCIQIIYSHRLSKNRYEKLFAASQKQQKLIDKEIICKLQKPYGFDEYSKDRELNSLEWEQSEFYQDDFRNDISLKRDLEVLSISAYSIYDHYFEGYNDIDEFEWLLKYAELCEEIIYDRYKTKIGDSFYQQLSHEFSKHDIIEEDYLFTDAVHEIIDLIEDDGILV